MSNNPMYAGFRRLYEQNERLENLLNEILSQLQGRSSPWPQVPSPDHPQKEYPASFGGVLTGDHY